MFKPKLVLLALALAAGAGLAAGHFYANLALTPTLAGDYVPSTPVPTPTWAKVHLVYLGPTPAVAPTFPTSFLAPVQAYVAPDFAAVQAFSAKYGLDILVIDELALGQVDPTWARGQYRQGTTFVALNTTPAVLGALVDDPDFANDKSWNKAHWPDLFYSYTYFQVQGPPEEIKLLEEHNALYPPNIDMQVKLGVNHVSVSFGRSYEPTTPTEFLRSLETLKPALDEGAGKQRVLPYTP